MPVGLFPFFHFMDFRNKHAQLGFHMTFLSKNYAGDHTGSGLN